jgi:gluconate 5-dehydrogenase
MFQLTELFDLTGKVALITGSSRGLGYAMAEGLAKAGATVILNGRNPESLNTAVAEFKEKGYAVHSAVFNVTDSAEIKAQVARISDTIGTIDILINNAGIQYREPLVDFDEEQWRNVMDVNVNGVFLTTKAVVPGMIKQESGKIINIASLMSDVSRPTIAAYVASKGAVMQLTKSMSTEWAIHNIQTNAIAPGYFKTELNVALFTDPEFNSWVEKRTPAGRWGELEELVGAAVFLSSKASSFVNGQMIRVEGGMLGTI